MNNCMDTSDNVSKPVAYIFNNELFKECDKIPNIQGRALLVHNLIKSYGLLSHMQLLPPELASEDDLISFHSREYIDFLNMMDDCSDLEKFEDDQCTFGLKYDCPIIEGIYKFARTIAGASLTAARMLVEGLALVAINWCGGWHHAQRDKAEGFCYINDVVIAIHTLRERFKSVIYIDLDVHHGNGVENAFAYTPHVLTFSLHHHMPGFYPGSGELTDVGAGNGKYYTVNVPLKDRIGDENYFRVFHMILCKIWKNFKPDAAVVQCGADGINGDTCCDFNLTPRGLGRCVESVLSRKVPTLFLGGGGYNLPNTSRCWTYLTSIILRKNISSSIPDINDDLLLYGPDFELHITPGNRVDLHSQSDLELLVKTVYNNLDKI